MRRQGIDLGLQSIEPASSGGLLGLLAFQRRKPRRKCLNIRFASVGGRCRTRRWSGGRRRSRGYLCLNGIQPCQQRTEIGRSSRRSWRGTGLPRL